MSLDYGVNPNDTDTDTDTDADRSKVPADPQHGATGRQFRRAALPPVSLGAIPQTSPPPFPT